MKKSLSCLSISYGAITLAIGLMILPVPSISRTVSPREAELVAANWLTLVTSLKNGWAGAPAPVIASVEALDYNDTVIGYHCTTAPGGWIVVPILREMPAITAYSVEGSADFAGDAGIFAIIKEHLMMAVRMFVANYGSTDSDAVPGDPVFTSDQASTWIDYCVDKTLFNTRLDKSSLSQLAEDDYLLRSNWHQRDPFDGYCPTGYSGRCVVGCVATAIAQILNYYSWPDKGNGTLQYVWDGDNSCLGGSTPGTTLSANFADAYDWANIVDNVSDINTPEEENAVAELCYEAGIAVKMDYGSCGSGVPIVETIKNTVNAFKSYFLYKNNIDSLSRSNYSSADWYSLIQAEVEAGRPMFYTYRYTGGAHAIVCDGARYLGGLKQVHLNYGWLDQSFNAWYTIDSIYGSSEANNERAISHIQPDRLMPPSKVWATYETFKDSIGVAWTSAPGANEYVFYRSEFNDTLTAARATGTIYNHIWDHGIINGVEYYYWIKAVSNNPSDTSSFSMVATGKACDFSLPAPTGVMASDGLYLDTIKITWNPVQGAEGYDILRSELLDLQTAIKSASCAGDKYALDDMNVVPGRIYYYWVRAKKLLPGLSLGAVSSPDLGYSDDREILLPPDTVRATKGSYTDKVVISWSVGRGAFGYALLRNAINSPQSAQTIAEITGTDNTIYEDFDVFENNIYYYWVKSKTFDPESYSPVGQYDSGYVITRVQLKYLEDGLPIKGDKDPELCWYPVSTAIKYNLQISTDSTFQTGIELDDDMDPTCHDGYLWPAGWHYWRVTYKTVDGWTNVWSDVWSFHVGCPGMVIPNESLIPPDSTFISPANIRFYWRSDQFAESYTFELASSPDFVNNKYYSSTTTDTSLAYTVLDTSYWRVKANCRGDSCPDGPWTNPLIVDAEGLLSDQKTPMFELAQNYPNPFNSATRIQFTLPRASMVAIEIYNIVGARVRVITNTWYPAGLQTAEWDGRSDSGILLPSGVYFYRIVADEFAETRKMILVK